MKKIKKIVLVGHDNKGSARLFEMILNAYPQLEFMLIIGEGLYYKKTFIYSVLKLLKEASWIFVLIRFYELVIFKIFGTSLEEVAKKNGVQVLKTWDINSPEIIGVLQKFAPDILVSLFTMQIYKSEIINLPKYGAITSHPSILPSYRGLEVFFWVLANDEVETGVSIFEITERIDDGEVIWQARVPITEGTTVNSLYDEITEIGGRGLIQAISDIDAGFKVVFPKTLPSSYYGMPTSESMKRFLKHKKKFF